MKKVATPNGNVPVIKEGFGLAAKELAQRMPSRAAPSTMSPMDAAALLSSLQKVPEGKRKVLVKTLAGRSIPAMKKGGAVKKAAKPMKAKARKK